MSSALSTLSLCNIFLGLTHYFFLIFGLEVGFNKLITDGAHFLRKILLFPKWGEWGIFGSNINFLEFFCKFLISATKFFYFLRFCMKADIKKWVKLTVLAFKKNLYYAQNEVNGSFLDLKSIFLNFLKIFVARSF